jgi:hypothetical protein
MLAKTVLKMLILLILSAVFLAAFPSAAVAQNTKLYVDPPTLAGLEVGNIFQVNITVSNVLDLYAWQFTLFYRGDILNATNIEEGPFLKTHPDTDQTYFVTPIFTDSYNNTDQGKIISSSTLVGVKGGVNGNGTLATITFQVKAEGSSPLAFAETILVDSVEPFGNRILHVTVNGMIHVGLHDVAITNTKTSKTIAADTIVYINITVENQGRTAESFSITTYYNSNQIETKTVTDLQSGSSIVVTFAWDTTPVPKGNYTISAVASLVPGETETEDNTHIDGQIQETIPGDVTGDRAVNILDISKVAKIFGATEADPKWDPNVDLDDNGLINIVDITKVAKEFGKVDP